MYIYIICVCYSTARKFKLEERISDMDMEVANNMAIKENDKEEDEGALPGFRFHPTDEELVGFYLRRKVEKRPISIELIKQTDIYKYDPWDLPSKIHLIILRLLFFLFSSLLVRPRYYG